ncbi:MAG: EAL domain-containing protein [Terracidiphilus sp.]
MPIHQKSAAIAIIATVGATACGLLAGYVLGRALVLRHVENKLDQYAMRIRREAETATAESRTMLAALNASSFPYCSDTEIAWMRKLIFQSEFLKDGGHMRDGRIDCSATLGRPSQPGAQFKPEFSRQDGTRVYLNLAPLRVGDRTVVSVQLGDSFIVYSPYNLKDLGSASMHFTVSEVDVASGQTGRLVGELTHAQASTLTREGRAREGDTLYVTRCSSLYTSCMTAFISVPEALGAERGEFRAYIAFSGICGALFGIACSLLYHRRQSMEQQLRRAIRRDRLRVVYQPIVELASRKIVAAEALVRWTDDDNFEIRPEVFVKIAEERGFVGTITQLVVRHLLRDCHDILLDRPEFRVNLNIAAADLGDAQFLPMLEGAFARAGVRAQSLGIEITESYTARLQVAKDAILQLRRMGHKVHIDDFGTGYSSLSYLHDLEVDGIKIDRAFTRAIGTDSVTVSIVPQILAMAAALKLEVTVEGIETEEQADYFAACALPILAQGWYFGYPLPAAELHGLLRKAEQRVEVGADAD